MIGVKIKKQTDNKFLNMYRARVKKKSGKESDYFFASRIQDENSLIAVTHEDKAAGVDIVAFAGDKIVLVKQYRVPIDGYIYECPAGLCEEGEDVVSAAIREMKEETGLDFTPYDIPKGWQRPFYTSVGMSDEACSTVFGSACGEISLENLEDGERLEVVLCDIEEASRILSCERVSIRCAHVLMRFVKEGPFHP